MTTTQIKKAYAILPEKEKASIAAWIKAERLSRDAAYAVELGRRQRKMDTGKKWPLAESRQLSRELARRGL